MNEFVYYYRIKEDGTVALLRVFGNTPFVSVPSQIDNRFVSEIGSYCFSKTNKVKDYIQTTGDISLLEEIAGEKVESIILPDSILKIDSYAFYNCRKCKEICFSNIQEIGSDVFLNCLSLHSIKMNCEYKNAVALKLFLKQITWDIDVTFNDATLSFPEYYENYNVIGPAHIFGVNISGEGYRARQCFLNNKFLIHEYDSIFEKLCVEESVKTLCHFALNRLLFPKDLQKHHLDQYTSFVKEHPLDVSMPILLSKDLSKEEKIHRLFFLVQNEYLDVSSINILIEKASNLEMIELSTYLIQWKKEYFTIKNTYDFEDF